ncbi:hypothetical protein OBBRIDRAFT_343267 [Obba rivulosa]|uniref:Zinc finger Mcm10/DnaG-type domain-containing protein n=1 Tax=Obba rivulosa TaxID=1052685 RepID=A0A8E2AIE4_9APHY|nr:hypothetical protein OBBRIDRAFT_343267 [Obba rivulosa]
MESSTNRQELERREQAEIRKQIALLQSQLVDLPGDTPHNPAPGTPKRKKRQASVLAPATPSPKKRKTGHEPGRRAAQAASTGSSSSSRKLPPSIVASRSSKAHAPSPHVSTVEQPPSTVLKKLASAHASSSRVTPAEAVTRSSDFTEKPAHFERPVPERDDRLALVEELLPGPVEHKAPFDDPHFEKLEPNSGIRLSSREVEHETVQEHLRGRYYLSPSKLYSVIRLLPNKQGYDVPVGGDWLTIAVVAERGPLKYSQAPVGTGREENATQDDENTMDQLELSPNKSTNPPRPNPYKGKGKGKAEAETNKPSGKRYVNLKLVDFGCRMRSSSTTGGQAAIRGDAFLSLLLFESDGYDVVAYPDGRKEKLYKGGSRGAFEKISKLKEGAVVALLNPRILKPFQRSGDVPHPTDNILAITPESVGSILVIGHAQDLGMCNVVKRDGKVCGGWCDKRVSDVCEWHMQHAVQRQRAGRAEFSVGTSGMTTQAKKKPAYDPARKWGLTPEDSGVGSTYVVSGHIVSNGSDPRSLYVSETVGRDAQAKAARKLSSKDTDLALRKLLQRDKEGTKALAKAREFVKHAQQSESGKGVEGKAKGKGKASDAKDIQLVSLDSEESEEEDERPKKNVYSAELIRQLGFDPTAKDGKRSTDPNVKGKLDALAALQSTRNIELGPRPGKKISCVQRPQRTLVEPPSSLFQGSRHSPERENSPLNFPASDSEDEGTASVPVKFVNLDDSSDLEIEPAT